MHQQCQQPHSSSAMWKNAHGFTEKRQLAVREKGNLFFKKNNTTMMSFHTRVMQSPVCAVAEAPPSKSSQMRDR